MCAGYLVGCGWWGGWRVVGVLALVLGFWLGLGSGVGVSGGWGCSAGGCWFLGGGWCGVWGLFPLDPSLTPAPTCLVGCGSWFGSSLCWVVVSAGWWVSCGLRFFSVGVGWSCGWFVLLVVFWLGCSRPGVVVAVLVGRLGSAVCLLGVLCGCGLCGLCSVSGGCSQAGCVVPVGRADLDGRALRRPPLSPPTVHDKPSQTPESGGQTHTLKR